MKSDDSAATPGRREHDATASAEYLREETLGVLAHDLRAPLASILAATDLLIAQGGLPTAQLRLARHIEASAERMARMIADLLDVTREHRAGGLPVSPRLIDLRALCLRAVEEFGLTHADRVILADAPLAVWGAWDPDRLAQVVTNLLANALAYGRPDRPVRLTLRGGDTDVGITVHNEGPAIAPSRVATLFEPFRPAGPLSETERRSKGLGLGLYIVHAIVTAHGGTVVVESAPESGTTFTITLPRAGAAPGAVIDRVAP